MKTIKLLHSQYCIVTVSTPELSEADLQEVCSPSQLNNNHASSHPLSVGSDAGSLSDQDAGHPQVRRLHKRCWPGEHEDQEESLASFLDHATFLLDAETVIWLLLWEHARLRRRDAPRNMRRVAVEFC